ncbi:peptidoglycan DD-metalloendopeptidase family protein [Flavobacterium sp. XN-5]|uniref:peptidoglycan DD-metalloendopeptidase family protein n=1 Tax=Flavobacterium sp. XN-5 TaxID=2599390 RepID=UPI0011C8475A|nr:peptidoglycan DD-metalloendopeptidase family protein [Flavobacterium sp. XN-5]NGY37027.1 peptidoglycan DD-metalloendopeptidase family protein [Flavobacterium sp. XN-5]
MKNHYQLITSIILIVVSCATPLQAQDRTVEVTSVRNDNKSVDFFYTKNKPGSYTVKIEFNSLSNTSTSLLHEQVVEGNSGRLLSLKPTNSELGIGYGYKTSYAFGNSEPKVDSLFQYLLPFKKGTQITIYESSNLNEKYFGAEKPESWKSYSTNSKTVDSVFAMRKGIVVNLKNEFQNDTITKMLYTSKTNSIQIEHEDGTYASYSGFKKDSFKVKLGDIVYPNTMLGTLANFNNEKYILHFSIYYFDKNRMFESSKSLRASKTPHVYLTPYFYTAAGAIKIIPKNSFTADCNESIIIKEMSKREIKQLLKNKEI